VTDDRAEVLGGHCTVEDGELVVSRSIRRTVNPLMWLLTVAFLALGLVQFLTPAEFTRDVRPADDASLLALAVFQFVLVVVDAYRTAGRDLRVPLRAIREVRVETERRRWYFKTRKELPMVVLTVDRRDGATDHSIRLDASEADRQASALLVLLSRHGVEVPPDDPSATAGRQA